MPAFSSSNPDAQRVDEAIQRLAAIVESSEDAIIGKDLDGVITSWNAGAERLFGYAVQEAIGQSITLIIPPDRSEEEPDVLARIRRGERIEHYETVRRRKDGTFIDVSLTVSPILNNQRQVVGASKIARDITERRQTERALAEKARLLDVTRDAVVVVRDLEGKITFWNKGAEKFYGWAALEVFGKDLHGLLQTEFPKPMAEILAQLQRDGEFSGEVTQVTRLGRRVSSLCRWVLDPSTKSILTSYTDITERKKAEEALRESEQRFRALTTATSEVLYRMSPDWSEMRQLNGGDFIPNTEKPSRTWLQQYIPPDEQQLVSEAISKAIQNKNVFELEHRVQRADGTQGWLFSRAIPLLDDQGEIIEWFGAASDITDRKQAQADLQHHAANLEMVVAERTAKLRESISELEAFSYSLSHDMRAALRAIRAYAELAREEGGERVSPLLSKVVSAASRLDRMIQDVLSYTRVSRQEIKLETVDVDRLVREITSERPELHLPRARVIVQHPLLPVLGYEASVTQCLTNLLGNAVKFVLSDVMPEVRVYSESRDGAVRLWIADNGIGIEKAAQPKLFEMFSRVNSFQGYEGTGLGLAIVRKAAERMGGQVGVESDPGKGSRFWLQLLRAEEVAAPIVDSNQERNQPG